MIVRKQRRVDGKKQNYYWDDVLLVEVPKPERKVRDDAGTARVWRIGMSKELADGNNAVIRRLKGEKVHLSKKVEAADTTVLQLKQAELYARIDAVQGVTQLQRQQAVRAVQDLGSLTLSYVPYVWDEYLQCAEYAVRALEAKLSYLVDTLTIDSILEEQVRAEALALVDEEKVISKYVEPIPLDIGGSLLPF